MKVPLIDLNQIAPADESEPSAPLIISQDMPEPVGIPDSLKRMGTPQRVSVYRHPDGLAAFAVMRWDRGGKKITLPIAYDGEAFVNAGYPYQRPLYNSDELAAHPDAPVLVVEGEKTAEDGARYLPAGWCITTWSGGVNSINRSDWSILRGRRVVIWPDNDPSGLTAAGEIADMIGPGAGVVNLPDGLPPAWDLADPLPDGISEQMVAASIRAALKDAPAPAVISVIPDTPPAVIEVEEDGFIDEHLEWRALGFDDGYYYIMPASTGVILKTTARELMSPAGCLRIINDVQHWVGAFPKGKGDVDWLLAGSSIMRACEAVGYYDERRLRGRGVWMDETRVIVNTGDLLYVDGRAVSPVKVRSKHIYKTAEALFVDDYGGQSPAATDAEGRVISELCNAPRWDKPVHGELLAGYIATSMVCGALDWRTHVWVTGNAGSGKSTVINTIAAACIGDIAVYPMGETTESGIRQHIGNDARPVIFDEMEGTDQQRTSNDGRRQAIIQLMRMASSDSPGRIMKGSSSHKGVAFTMRSSFLVASIGMALKEAPDLTRTLVLTLKPLPSDATDEQRAEANERYAMLNRLAAKLPSDIPTRLFQRMTRLVPVLRKNAETFREVIADVLGNRRLGDQVGTLLAGRCALTSDRVMTKEQCEAYVREFEWHDVVMAPGDREDRQLMNHLKQSITRIVDVHGRPQERTVGELVSIAFGLEVDELLRGDSVQKALMRFGIRVDRLADGVWLSSRNEELNKFMRTSTNPGDWYSVVARNPMAERSSKPIQFAGGWTSAVLIPKGEWYA